MKIAYFTNQYPHVRHTFIRRELLAVEAYGVEVLRYSVRSSGADAVDAADRAEHQKTRAILAANKLSLLFILLATMIGRPVRFLRALRWTVRLGRRSDRGVLRHLIYLVEACVLRRWLAQDGATHLHVHFATNPAAVAMLCRELGGPTYSIMVHGAEEWDRPEALSLRDKYEKALFVASASDYGRAQVMRWTNALTWPRCHVIRCGVDEGFLNINVDPVPDTKQLVLVGGLVEQKGHLLVIQALGRVRDAGEDFRMVFVGDGPMRALLVAEMGRLSLGDRIQFLGWQTNAEVRDHLRRSRCLVMPSFAENLPVAMMEAMALGRPVIGTYIAGVPELVVPGVNGWLVPTGNVELTANAILAMLRTPVAELTRMGKNGRQAVLEKHQASNEAKRLVELFRQYLQPSAPPTP